MGDIKVEDLNAADVNCGFKLSFHFKENPYFSQAVLCKECHTIEDNPYDGDIRCVKIESTVVDWKAGKNVTVDNEDPQSSFFRHFFRTWKLGMALPGDVNIDPEDMEEGDDENDLIGLLMNQDYEIGSALRDSIIP